MVPERCVVGLGTRDERRRAGNPAGAGGAADSATSEGAALGPIGAMQFEPLRLPAPDARLVDVAKHASGFEGARELFKLGSARAARAKATLVLECAPPAGEPVPSRRALRGRGQRAPASPPLTRAADRAHRVTARGASRALPAARPVGS